MKCNKYLFEALINTQMLLSLAVDSKHEETEVKVQAKKIKQYKEHKPQKQNVKLDNSSKGQVKTKNDVQYEHQPIDSELDIKLKEIIIKFVQDKPEHTQEIEKMGQKEREARWQKKW